MYTLHHSKGCGSTAIEAVLALADAPYRIVDVAWESIPGDETLRRLNPLSQVPTLITPGGEVMTESAAILVHLVERFPDAGLAPPPGSDERARLWRWVVFLAVNVYKPIIIGDHPDQWTTGDTEPLLAGHRAQLERAWKIFEAEVAARPLPATTRPSVLDVYLAMISRWRPGRAWIEANVPAIAAIAHRAEADPTVAAIWARNFD